ncbi:MAG: hypothetical protein J6M64_04865 [Oscillospiraceae bacterium]|nr:hypothetical protein [Oscillospiraceae bacterium]
MFSYETNTITVIGLSAPYEIKCASGVDKTAQKIRVVYHGRSQKGLPKKLTIKNDVYPLDNIKLGAWYKMICDSNGIVLFFLDIPTYHQREAFVGEYFPMITKTILSLESAFQFCGDKNDRKLLKATMNDLFYTLIALGRESVLPQDDVFFTQLPF